MPGAAFYHFTESILQSLNPSNPSHLFGPAVKAG
jgi:hypothetical protein